MRPLILLSILSLGYCQLLGGKSDVDLSKKNARKEYLTKSLAALGLEAGTNEDIEVVKVQTQVDFFLHRIWHYLQ